MVLQKFSVSQLQTQSDVQVKAGLNWSPLAPGVLLRIFLAFLGLWRHCSGFFMLTGILCVSFCIQVPPGYDDTNHDDLDIHYEDNLQIRIHSEALGAKNFSI